MSAFTLIEGDVTLRSSGIETAVGDGLPLPIGTKGYIGVGFDGTNTRFIRVDSAGQTIIVGPDAAGAAATSNPVVVGGIDLGGFVRQLFTDSSGRQRIVGAADHGSPIAGYPVLVAGSDGTNAYRLLTDTAGRLQVGTIQLPAALVGGRLDTNIGAWFGSTAPTVGQKVMADSIPVVLASDQTAIQTTTATASTSAVTNVTGAVADTLVLAANAARLGATIYNNTNKRMYLKLGTGPSTTSFTLIIQRDGYYEVPFGYVGVIRAVWDTGVSGDALVTELTA